MTLAELLQTESAPLTSRLHRIVRDRETAEDLRQEAFARAWATVPRDVDSGQQRRWLHRVATNLALDELRRRRVRTHVTLDEAADAPLPDVAADSAAMREALGRLSEDESVVLMLRVHAGLSLREIASVLGISEEAARKRVARARGKFMRAIADERGSAVAPVVLFVSADSEAHPYERLLEQAGAEVRRLERSVADLQFLSADAVVVSGCVDDIDPALYGDRPRANRGARPGDDRADLRLLQLALAHDKPILGICRGHQLLNIAAGGSLYQDLTEAGAAQAHDGGEHTIEVARDSGVRHVIGGSTTIASDHHQMIRRLGYGVKVASVSPDGVVEAIELPRRRFAVGVQWHAEKTENAGPGERLAAALVDVSMRRRGVAA